MNKHQKIAYQNLKNAFNWIIGGYYNSIQDGMFEDTNTPEVRRENLFNEIYDATLNDDYRCAGAALYGAPIYSVRFAGKAFIQSKLNELLDSDEDAQEIIYYEN